MRTPTPQPENTGKWFSQQIQTFGISEEWFEERGYRKTTVAQYSKPSATLPESFAHKFAKELEGSIERGRELIRERNRVQFQTVSFSLYAYGLPPLPIEKLPGSQFSIRTGLTAGGDPQSMIITQSEWTEHCLSDCSAIMCGGGGGGGVNVVVIMGDPGSGKTTELKRLLLHFQQENPWTCVFIPLSIYGSGNADTDIPRDLYEAAARYYTGRLGLDLGFDFSLFLAEEERRGRLVLFLDSLDEAPVSKRDAVASQIAIHEVPIFVTSRYVAPRLDRQEAGLSAARTWHLDGLTLTQVQDHVGLLHGHFDGILNPESPTLKGLNDLRGMLGGRYHNAAGEDHDSDEEIIRLIKQPLYLNLYIGLCLERGLADNSVDHIVSRYIDFLLSNWAMARSELPRSTSDTVALKRVLAYLGFELTIREYQRIDPPTPDEAGRILLDYFKATEEAGRSEEVLIERVTDAMDRARNAQLFEPDNAEYIKFSAPADVLREHHLAQFISQSSLGYLPDIGRPRLRPEHHSLPALTEATFQNFLRNPNLRFLKKGMELHLKYLTTNSSFTEYFSGRLLDMALETLPVNLERYDVSFDQSQSILPLNYIFVNNVVSSLSQSENYPQGAAARAKLTKIYQDTNFERVFRECHHIVPKSEAIEDASFDFTSIDKKQRLMALNNLIAVGSNQLLPALSDQGRLAKREADILLRRNTYYLRYCAKDFNQEAADWLQKLYKLGGPIGENALMSARAVAKDQKNVDWSFFKNVFEDNKQTEKRLLSDLRRTWWKSKDDNKLGIDNLIREVVHNDDKFSFFEIHRERAFWKEISNEGFDVPKSITTLAAILQEDLIPAHEGKALFILENLARNFEVQQAIMPTEYHLKSWCRPPAFKRDSRAADTILRHLCSLAVKHLPEDHDPVSKAGDEMSQTAELQLYDFAVNTLWTIFGDYTDA